MAKITRKTQKILGGNSSNTGIFGNAQKGIYDQFSQDPDVIQTTEWESGWNQATFSGAKIPALEERQGVDFVVTRQIAYVLQEGIPEWDSETEYHENSIVKESGTTNLYYSITDNNIGNPLSDPLNWTQFSFGVSDGDKGDVTVSASGNTWTINTGAVSTDKVLAKNITFAKIQDIPTRKILGRSTAGTGSVEELDFIDDPTFLTATDVNIPSALSVSELVQASTKVKQVVTATSSSAITTTTPVLVDNSVPQSTEGAEFISVTITPTSSSSKVLLIFSGMFGCTVASNIITAFLLRNSGTSALYAIGGQASNSANSVTPISFQFVDSPATTSATTYRVRAGTQTTATVRGNAAGDGSSYGGVQAMTLIAIEI